MFERDPGTSFADRYRNDVLLRVGSIVDSIMGTASILRSSSSAELTPARRELLELEMEDYLSRLGLKSFSDFLDFRFSYKLRVDERVKSPITDNNFPDIENFTTSFAHLLLNEQPIELPRLGIPLASQVAAYGISEWRTLTYPSSVELPSEYLYILARIMSDPVAYKAVIEVGDEIRINRWQVVNGRHRSLALKVLGEEYVRKSGIDEWVKVL